MKYIYIDGKCRQNKVAIFKEEKLIEYHIEEQSNKDLIGNIYRARVDNVLKGIEAAFVDIGEDKNAYLPLKDVIKNMKPIRSGDEILVQITKEPYDKKGAKITTDLTIPGRYLVLTPYSRGINISRRIKEESEIDRLKSIGKDIRKENIGMIIRTASNSIDRESIVEEYKYLLEIFTKIDAQRNFLPTPKLIYKDLGFIYRKIRDILHIEDYKIVVNNRKMYEQILQWAEYLDLSLDKIVLNKKFSMEYNESIQKGIEEAFNKKIELESGGYIVIDETEALTAIDVNTGKYVGDVSYEETIFNTNMEATAEIARQLKLRNIGGIIIIDFIDMKNEKDVSKVLASLKNHFKTDKNKPNIHGITKLGLAEVTRKRTGSSLSSQIAAKCSKCKGRGRIKIQ